ncbi:MAG: Mur ligase family protein [Pseudomonadota bacterium]
MQKTINPHLKPDPNERPPPSDEELQQSATLARQRSNAVFIGVTGSSAKSSTTGLLAHILSALVQVELQIKLNNKRATFDKLSHLPEDAKLVLAELGVSTIDSYRDTTQVFQPNIAVVTMVRLEHKERLKTVEGIAAEKAELVIALRKGGLAVLNADDPLVMGMSRHTNERIVSFGRSKNADYRVSDLKSNYPNRMSLTINYGDKSLPLQTRFVGDHHWLATAAAVSTALEYGVPEGIVAKQVASFEPLYDRCGAIETVNGPNFIVDTAKMPGHSIQLAFDVVAKATAPRKRIVLGPVTRQDEQGSIYSDLYRSAMMVADQVVFVGKHFDLADADQEDIDAGRFFLFETTEQAADHIRDTAMPGELILVKGNVSLHLERIALSWRHKVQCWHPACGIRLGCMDCGRVGFPFDWHQGHKRPGKVRRLLNDLNLYWG